MPRRQTGSLALCAVIAWLGLVPPAAAHPHVFVTSRTEIIYAPDGMVQAMRHRWASTRLTRPIWSRGSTRMATAS